MGEIRVDPLSGESVIVAPVRNDRPHSEASHGRVERECVFCPGHEDQTPHSVLELRMSEGASWFVRVFPNLYPIVSSPMPRGGGSETSRPALGVHEVVVETPQHEQEMSQRTPQQLFLTLKAYRERLTSLLATGGIHYVAIFRNKGPRAGASLGHPHSQIVALHYTPRAVTQTVQRWRHHHARTGSCLLCDELQLECGAKSRIVLEQDGFILYVPHGATMPAEMVLAPLRHQTSFAGADDETLSRMSTVLLAALGRLHAAFDDPDYNLVLQTWPRARQKDEWLHWYLRIIPRLAVLGGFELSTGDYVVTLTPEDAAAKYRETQ